MSFQLSEFAQKITPDIYLRLKRALEMGKWPDGKFLDEKQKEICMQAIISYEYAHIPEGDRTGQLTQRCKNDTPKESAKGQIPLAERDA